jgi:DNA-binding CsgD family transcriptional regulator
MGSESRQRQHACIIERIEQLEANVQALELEIQTLRHLVQLPHTNPHNGKSHIRIDPPDDVVASLAKLSPRECEVLRHFAEVRICKRIASALGTEPQTVRNQLTSIRTKLGATTREEFWEIVLKLRPWLNNG